MHRFALTVRKHTALALIVTALLGGAFAAGRAWADQPHMRTALKDLEAAKQALETAANDKGGHRVKALEFVNSAIAEVREGIEFDRRH